MDVARGDVILSRYYFRESQNFLTKAGLIREASRIKINNQWETLWLYKGLKHNVINNQSEG